MRLLCPSILWNTLRLVCIKWFKRDTKVKKKRTVAQDRHEKLNAGLEKGKIRLRKDVLLNIHPDSYDAFEHFCFKSQDMVKELDMFISVAQSKSRCSILGRFMEFFLWFFARQIN